MEILKPSETALKKAVKIIKNGGVIVCPTDTVYGFLADATNKKAVEKIFKIKKRPKSKPLPIFIKDIASAKKFVQINKKGEKILRKYWPGKYTFILKRKPAVKLYGVDKKTIAIRIPKHKFLKDLLKKVNKPLVQTSVNISNSRPLNNLRDITAVFGKNRLLDFIIGDGSVKNPKPSKIYDFAQQVLTKIR